MTKRFLTHPGSVVAALFLGQLLFWYLFMPEQATLEGAASKYSSSAALLKWVLLFSLLEVGIILGTLIPIPHRFRITSWVQEWHIRFWWRWALVILSVTLLGELIYIRIFLQNPELFRESLIQRNLAILGEQVRSERVVGISSLNNLFILAAAILAVLGLHPLVPKPWAFRARCWLAGLGLAVLLHAIFLAARMFFVYYLLVVLAAYLTLRKVSAGLILRTFIILVVLLWAGELFRGGAVFAKANELPLTSLEVQAYIWERLVQGYLAADFNNALIVMDCDPSMQLWSTTMLAGPLGLQPTYDQCPGWQSVYGTVNVLALWWHDWGWSALVLAFAMGFVFGALYKLRLAIRQLRPEGLYYFLAFPGLFSIIRINYFFLTIWVVPFLFLTFVNLTYLIRMNLRGTRQ